MSAAFIWGDFLLYLDEANTPYTGFDFKKTREPDDQKSHVSGPAKVHHQPLSLMKTTFYNHAPVQMQIYVDCLFRPVLIHLHVHPPLFFCLVRDNVVIPVISLWVLWSGTPVKMTRGAFHKQQTSTPLAVWWWTRGSTKLMQWYGSHVSLLDVQLGDEEGTGRDRHAVPGSCWHLTGATSTEHSSTCSHVSQPHTPPLHTGFRAWTYLGGCDPYRSLPSSD